jgi:hypothetical protein
MSHTSACAACRQLSDLGSPKPRNAAARYYAARDGCLANTSSSTAKPAASSAVQPEQRLCSGCTA